ncbi:unnamed protein product, partial [Rotaria magnacalcarata]
PAKGKAEAHFEIHHYAGSVAYTATSWLEKNKDPINTTVAQLFGKSKNVLLSHLYADALEEEGGKGGGGKKKGGGSMQTISATHRVRTIEQIDGQFETNASSLCPMYYPE